MARSWITPSVTVGALLVLGVACGGDDDAAPVVTDAPAAVAPASAGPIVISSFSFGDPITVAVGSEVRVVNNDSSPHTWTAVDGTFDSGSLGIGEDFVFVFDTPGTYEFICEFHPSMTGSITVTD